MLGENYDARLKELTNNLQEWYKLQRKGVSRIQGKLTFERIKTSGD